MPRNLPIKMMTLAIIKSIKKDPNMLPEFIPYIIKRVSYVDHITGESHCWSYEEKYRLYHIPTMKLMKFSVYRAHYVDDSLVSSTAIVLERKDKSGHDKYTIVNTIEDLRSPLWFDYLEVVTPQLIIVRKDKKWGIVNSHLQMRCFFEYDSMDVYISSDLDRIFIIAKRNGKYGLLNEDLSQRFPFNYDSITCNSGLGIFVLQGASSTTVYDIEDNSISKFPFTATSIKEINEGCIIVENNRKYCVYDKDAQCFLCDRWFDEIDSFQKGFCLCDRRYILERNCHIIDLGEGKWFHRSGEIVYSATHLQGDEWLIKVYKKDKFLYEFSHTKESYGIFYCRIIGGKYVEVGRFSDKYSLHTPEALYDLEGNTVPLSATNGYEAKKNNPEKLTNIYHAHGFRVQPTKSYDIENVKEFENKYFSKSKYLTAYDDYDIVELEPNLLRLEIMSVDEDGCCWNLVGYIYNGIKMWVNINISND